MQSQLSLEKLEDRQLLAAAHPVQIIGGWFDNRGQVALNMSIGLNTTTVTRKTATIYLAGADAQFGTADDVMQYTAVGYRKGLLTLRANVAANTAYRVKLNANYIKDVNGNFLDGEFKGVGITTGNGVGGGNYDIVTVGGRTRARITTVIGAINVALYTKQVGTTCVNFVTYANEGAWDNSFFHRSVLKASDGIGVVQGGGYKVNASNQIDTVTSHAGIATQGQLSNTKGTIAMANTGQANSNTNQWYFNVVDNTNLDGGYSVFGVVMDSASQKVITAMNALPITDASGGNASSPFTDLPLLRQTTNITVPSDLVMTYRVAMLLDPSATPNVSVTAKQAPAPAIIPPAVSPFAAITAIRNPLFED